MSDSSKNKIFKEAKILTIILLSILIFRSSVYEPFRIPSGSMIPTLMIGDYILVSKFSYGFKLPFSDFSFFDINFDPIYLFGKKNPERGDVIVFKYPKDPSTNYIKRVVGLPGDTIEIVDKVIFVNGEAVETKEVDGRKYLEDMDDDYKEYNLKFFSSKIGKHEHLIQQDSDNYYSRYFDKITVKKDHFFVIGDNRDFSHDSRFWGEVPGKYIKGEALFVWFSMILPFGKKNFKFRPYRIFSSIE